MKEQDNCSLCHGALGGVRGNENVVNGVVMCDYCHARESWIVIQWDKWSARWSVMFYGTEQQAQSFYWNLRQKLQEYVDTAGEFPGVPRDPNACNCFQLELVAPRAVMRRSGFNIVRREGSKTTG